MVAKTIPGLMLEVVEGFSIETLNEEACRDWFLARLHPGGAFCPECRTEITSPKVLARFWSMGRVACHAPNCNRSFSAVTGTALNGVGIEFRALYLLLLMIGCGVSVNKVARQLGISNGAAYAWARKAKGMTSLDESEEGKGG